MERGCDEQDAHTNGKIYIKGRAVEMIEKELNFQKNDEESFKYLSTSFKDGYIEGLKRALLLIDNVE